MDEKNTKLIDRLIREHRNTIEKLDITLIEGISDLVYESLRCDKKIILFGNGGSAADAEHIAAEFVGRFNMTRDPLPAIALNSSGTLITALGNDFGFEHVYSKQIVGIANEGDVCIGISTSGESRNVLNGLYEAKNKKCKTILLTGASYVIVNNFDIVLKVESTTVPRIQEAHIFVGHMICECVENMLQP